MKESIKEENKRKGMKLKDKFKVCTLAKELTKKEKKQLFYE